MEIGIIGAGIIGRKLAEALLRSGHAVTVYSRTASKAQPVKAAGARVVDQPQEVMAGTQGVILALSDKKAIDDVLSRIKMTEKRQTVIQMGTISPQESRGLADFVTAAGGEYVECPILGSRREIEEKKLIMLFAGPRDALSRWSDVLTAFGPAPRYVGDVGQAAALKLALNNLIAVHAAGFALSLGIIEREGIDRDLFMDILRGSSLYAAMYDKKLPNWTQRRFNDPNFPTKHLRKDVELIAEHARKIGLNASVLDSIRDILDQTIAKGWGDSDYSSLIDVIHPADT